LLFYRFCHRRVLEKIEVQPVVGCLRRCPRRRLARGTTSGTTSGKTAWIDFLAGANAIT